MNCKVDRFIGFCFHNFIVSTISKYMSTITNSSSSFLIECSFDSSVVSTTVNSTKHNLIYMVIKTSWIILEVYIIFSIFLPCTNTLCYMFYSIIGPYHINLKKMITLVIENFLTDFWILDEISSYHTQWQPQFPTSLLICFTLLHHSRHVIITKFHLTKPHHPAYVHSCCIKLQENERTSYFFSKIDIKNFIWMQGCRQSISATICYHKTLV